MRKATLFVSCAIIAISASPTLPLETVEDNTEIAWESRDEVHLINLFTVGGRPINNDSEHKVKVLINHGYAVGYSEERRNPLWAVYKASELLGNDEAIRYERSRFFPPDTRVTPSVDGRTFGNDFDRGHMVPNAAIGNQWGTLAQAETFYMTNMCPQGADLNRGPWARLEKFIPELAESKEHIYVLCGPIFGDDPEITVKGPERGIQIPDAFYMILVDTTGESFDKPTVKLLAYRFPQDTVSGADFKDRTLFGTSVNDIELETGLDFFPDFGEMFTNWETKEGEVVAVHWTL